tara:strand:+ start:5213 stop:5737 length:525 start_codon:yes stop_codon:yes gene_type:complete
MLVKTEKQLRAKTRDFDFEKDEIFKLKEELVNTMWLESGLGVSANQLGHDVRVFTMRGETKEESLVCINPKIEAFSENMNTMEEGCLSIPDVFARVVRPAEIVVTFNNELNEEEKQNLDGLTARVFQHELDHLDGILFIDRIGPFARQRAFEKAKKIQKMRKRGKEKYKARFAL